MNLSTQSKPLFSPVLDRGFVLQSKRRPLVVVILNKGTNHFFRRLESPVPALGIHFRLDPAVYCFNYRIIRWSSRSRHRANYVILSMSIVECFRGIDRTLVSVQNDRSWLFLYFFNQILQAFVVRPHVTEPASDVA